MEYEIVKPFCVACQKEINSPSECIMEGFRLGFPIHTTCSEGVDRFLAAWKRTFGVEYMGAGTDLDHIEDEEDVEWQKA